MKTQNSALKGIAILFTICILFVNCKKEPLFEPNNDSITDNLNGVVDSVKAVVLDSVIQLGLGIIPQHSIIEQPVEIDASEGYENDSIYCTSRTYEWAPGREESLLMNPSAEVITPGSLLRAESITEGAYTPIIAARNPVCISLSMTNINGSPKDIIEDPSKYSSAQEGIQRLLSREINGNTTAQMTKETEKIYSYEQAKVALGANYKGFGFDVSASFDYTNTNIKSRYMVKFYQNYYSISIDLPAKPSDFFSEVPESILLGSYSPVYVSSIKYGRVVLFLLESEKSESEMNAKIEASFNAFASSGGIDASTHLKEVMESSTMKLFVVGGGAPDAARINSPEDVEEFIQSGANFSNQSPGVPIAYTLRFLKDNSVARVVMNSTYTVRQCEVVPATPFEFLPGDAFEFLPEHTNGDDDFGGDGFPHVTSNISLFISGDREVWMKVKIDFIEERPDNTEGSINENVKLFEVPQGYKIIKIVSDQNTQHFYSDLDHSIDEFDTANGELVSKFIFNGDSDGPDLPGTYIGADRAWAKFFLNKIVVAARKIQ
jgi:thiol-activated cytolysin